MRWLSSSLRATRSSAVVSRISCRTSPRSIVSMGVLSGDEVEGEVEGVEVAPLARRYIGDEFAVAEQRHLLLGDAAVAAQRFGEAREIVPRCRRAQHLVLCRDDNEIAQARSRQLETLRRLLP